MLLFDFTDRNVIADANYLILFQRTTVCVGVEMDM